MGLGTLLPCSPFITLLLLALHRRPAVSQSQPLYKICGGHNYAAKSTYGNNLRLLLSSLVANGSAPGSWADSVGDVPYTVYGVVLCRGDVGSDDCWACLAMAAREVVPACRYRTDAVIWYDHCLLRYTEKWSFRGILDGDMPAVYKWGTAHVTATYLNLFDEQRAKMLRSLAAYAARNSPAMFAIGEAEFPMINGPFISEDGGSAYMLYGLVQCSGGQWPKDCVECLIRIIEESQQRIPDSVGGRIIGTTCYVMYELNTVPFYNGSAMVRIPSPIGLSVPGPARALPALLPSDVPTSRENKLRRVKRFYVIIGVGIVIGLIGTMTCISIWRMKTSKKTHYIGEIPYIRSLLFDLTTLRVATDNFSTSNKLGEGGFGVVYKGILASGQILAVKRLLASSKQGFEELRNEVELLAKQEHRNLVRLLGVCMEEENLLVYEYVPNKSLDNFLFDSTKKKQLIWQLRYNIIEGVARGLLYLHEESQYTVIHRDLKASNILLDANMNPKISDFGISRLFLGDKTHASTSRVVGTFGYMAPEYVINGQFSKKSDVFSFGVLVLEIVTGRRNSSFSYSEGSINLLSYVWERWTIGAVQEIIDPSFSDQYEENEVVRCIHIGLLCVQQAPADRPAMSSVVLMLDSLSMTLNAPLQPAFFLGQSKIVRHQTTMPSLNELSISELDAR